MKMPKWRGLEAILVLGLVVTCLPAVKTTAQEITRSFPETGKTLEGKFLEYWNTHGGLEQQGYPISNEMQERSDIDGKTYTVQYFERAVFERHPENSAPNDVLLSLLGVLSYRDKYPTGAPSQTANEQPSSIYFQETGKHLGGRFLDYWQAHGGLAQQGFPISDEFAEQSALDGKTYLVQYFERAVFEYHPENQPPYDVLLSQLGTLRYRDKYLQPSPTATSRIVPTPTSTSAPTITLAPSATPTVDIHNCDGIPPTNPNEMEIEPTCIQLWGTVNIRGVDFHEPFVSVYATMPNGEVLGAPFGVPVQNNDKTANVELIVDDQTPYYGIWIITMEGRYTGRKVYGYFKLVPPGTPLPPEQ